DRRRPAERRPAALPGLGRGPPADNRGLLPTGGDADPPRIDRPRPALFRPAWPRDPLRRGRRGELAPVGLHVRSPSPRRLERVPSRGRGLALGGARGLRPAVLPGAVAGRGGRRPGRIGAHAQAAMAGGAPATGRGPPRGDSRTLIAASIQRYPMTAP